jgi:hypothetical protein
MTGRDEGELECYLLSMEGFMRVSILYNCNTSRGRRRYYSTLDRNESHDHLNTWRNVSEEARVVKERGKDIIN